VDFFLSGGIDMIQFVQDASLNGRNIPFGYVEVQYPQQLQTADFRRLVEREIALLKEKYAGYDRKTVFGENPYFRFFKKFKKTYPVMMQFESILLKDRPFPQFNPVAEIAFLMEIVTHVLSGAHDVDQISGPVQLYSATEKEEFPGLRGQPFHTYPGDFCGRDDKGIIFSLIAGADERTCARLDSTHVFYPLFGTPDLPASVLEEAMEVLVRYVKVLAPEAEIHTCIL